VFHKFLLRLVQVLVQVYGRATSLKGSLVVAHLWRAGTRSSLFRILSVGFGSLWEVLLGAEEDSRPEGASGV
jgi:hypothetical protein